MVDLDDAVATVVDRCLGVTAEEDVLVIVDPDTRTIGETLRAVAGARGADAVLAVMDERCHRRHRAGVPDWSRSVRVRCLHSRDH